MNIGSCGGRAVTSFQTSQKMWVIMGAFDRRAWLEYAL
jgi:hypothetical protein